MCDWVPQKLKLHTILPSQTQTSCKASGHRRGRSRHCIHTLKSSTLASERDILSKGMVPNFWFGYQMRVPSHRRITVLCNPKTKSGMQVLQSGCILPKATIYIILATLCFGRSVPEAKQASNPDIQQQSIVPISAGRGMQKTAGWVSRVDGTVPANCKGGGHYHKRQLLHNTVLSSSTSRSICANEQGIPHIKGVYHKQQNDRVEQVHDGVAEGEGEGNNDGGHGEPHLGQVHLYNTCQHSLVQPAQHSPHPLDQ